MKKRLRPLFTPLRGLSFFQQKLQDGLTGMSCIRGHFSFDVSLCSMQTPEQSVPFMYVYMSFLMKLPIQTIRTKRCRVYFSGQGFATRSTTLQDLPPHVILDSCQLLRSLLNYAEGYGIKTCFLCKFDLTHSILLLTPLT